MQFTRLKRFSNNLTEELKTILNSLNFKCIFNPSYQLYENKHYISFRGNSKLFKYKRGNRIIRVIEDTTKAFLIILDNKFNIIAIKNLSNIYLELYGIEKVQDGKLYVIKDKLFISFNTGWDTKGNDIYLAEVNDDFPIPKKCILAGRMRMEKNWSFFSANNGLFAIYCLNPLIIIEVFLIESDKIHFKKSDPYVNGDPIKNLSIGSNLVLHNNDYFLAAHEKLFFNGKRIYFGKIFRLSLSNGNLIIKKIYPTRFIHSFKSLLGRRTKSNQNLISCSYISGLFLDEVNNKLILSYGINDLNFSFSAIDLNFFDEN